jgi:hypothetical protein
MSALPLSRRAFLIASAAAGLAVRPALASEPLVQVAKDPNCGCCGAWVAILEQAGFPVAVTEMEPEALARHKLDRGVPPAMASCHTALVEGYVLEGHVPVADIRRLLATRPPAIGLAVPGMPIGSPGMGPESRREAYSVHLVRADGTTQVFSTYEAA